jgi:hypothetical protein
MQVNAPEKLCGGLPRAEGNGSPLRVIRARFDLHQMPLL